MKLDDQVCSLELAKKLNELGVKQESYFSWTRDIVETNYWLMPSRNMVGVEPGYSIPAYTAAELGAMLPYSVRENNLILIFHSVKSPDNEEFGLEYYQLDRDTTQTELGKYAATEADARAKMLIYLIENKLIHGTEEK